MPRYSTRDVQRIAGIKPAALQALISAGHVTPGKGRSGGRQFSLQDLLVLRSAVLLSAARLSPRRMGRTLRALRARLPDTVPLAGLSITAVGDRVVVREGFRHRDSRAGPHLLALAVEMTASELHIAEMDDTGREDPEEHFTLGCQSEECEDLGAALAAYERCLAANRNHLDARINCGRLLHLAGRHVDAERIYKDARQVDGTLLYNLAVLLEDLGRDSEAAKAYREALEADPALADAHYNLACLHERAGNARDCIRHLMAYRRITR